MPSHVTGDVAMIFRAIAGRGLRARYCQERAARSDTPNCAANSFAPTSLMYSDSVTDGHFNTIRVAEQAVSDTICSVILPDGLLHNLCVNALDSDTDFIGREQGRRIAACRELRGWKQEDLAKATGWVPEKPDRLQPGTLSPSRIGNYEQGERRLPVEAAQILERVFARPAAYFMAVLDENEAELVSTLRRQRGS